MTVSTSEPSVCDLLWRGLNPLGRAGLILLVIVVLSFFIPWEPFRLFHGKTPVQWHFAACVLLLMIDVPLALTVWHRRTVRTMAVVLFMIDIPLALKVWNLRTAPTMAVLFLAAAIGNFIFAHFKVTGDRSWSPHTPFMLIWTLLLLLDGLGRKPDPAMDNPGTAEAQTRTAAEHRADDTKR